MLTLWYILTCWVVFSTVTAMHLDALPKHEVLGSLAKYRHRAKHGHSSHGRHRTSHRSHSSQGRHSSSRRRHYPHELETLFGEDKKEERTVCQTEECKLIARIIKDNINKTVDPCNNFYDYACGKFQENNPIPPGEDSWSFIQMMERNLQKQLEEILEKDSDPDDLLTVKLGKKYYRTCMDRKSRERKGLEPLITTMARIGGWPMIMEDEEWGESEYTWQKVDDYYASITGFNTFYNLNAYFSEMINETVATMVLPRVPVGARRLEINFDDDESKEKCDCSKNENEDDSKGDDDSKDDKDDKDDKENGSNESGENKSVNDDDDESQQDSQEPGSKDEESSELDDSNENHNTTEEYMNMITEVTMAIAETRGFKISEHRIAADINDMMLFQTKLIKTIVYNLMNEDKLMPLQEFQELYDNSSFATDNSKINFVGKILGLLGSANVEADDDLQVNVLSADYYLDLGGLLDETPNRVIINYIHWLYISHFLDATTEKMNILHYVLERNERPKEETLSNKDWMEKCLTEVGLMDITSYAFVKKYFPDEIENTAEEMISYVQKEVEREISESEWLDDNIREFATEKVRNMKKSVGYPPWYSNTTIVKNYYKGLMIGPSYFENRMSFSRYMKWKSLRVLRTKSVDEPKEDVYDVMPLVLNALYAPFDNMMIMTAADFQNPFFALSRPAIINYGIVGAIMGHEVNHGFDDNGRMYNKNGQEIKWMDTMAAAYNKRVECFVDQYNNLVMEKLLKNKKKNMRSYGNRTMNENIADTMGLEASLGAYHIYIKENKDKKEEVLPGLENLTTEQLFFLSYANIFCEVLSPERLKKYNGDQHSTGRLRVLGPISNSESFAKAFNCPVGSPMNPERKCNIWK
ncbi:hypothetical protein KPH14_007530 [Odynerus spinipes]|uniref:Uncharacterized protein n=1 Tax=Odynerus spinipes TaxID=1348599 RepID=A0AAD9RIS0_9HYME|nr:hypothetical protein KPH14_007530 [Odynerus spinipes]